MEGLVKLTYGIINGITSDVFPQLTYEQQPDGSKKKRKLHHKLILAKHYNHDVFNAPIKAFDKAKQELMDECCEKDEDGSLKTEEIKGSKNGMRKICFKEGKEEVFKEKISDLLNTEVEVEVIKVPISVFPEYIEEDILRACAFMIEEYEAISDFD